MATLFNRQGKPIQVPDDQVLQALQSGKYGLPKGQVISMVDQEGSVYEFGVQDALAAAQEGFSFEGAEQRAQRELQEEYGGRDAEAAIYGGLRGLTFGLSDAILPELGLADREDMAKIRQANPETSMAGEMVTIAGSLFVPGGQGRLLGGLRGLSAPVRGVAKLGRGTERLAGRLLAPVAERGVLGRTLAKGLELGAGSAIEGAIYGGGQFISEASLGDIDATAENLLGHVGMGAALGGGFGVALGSGFQGLKELVAGGGRLTKAGGRAVAEMFEKHTGNKAMPGLGDAYARVSGAVTGYADETARLAKMDELIEATAPLKVRGQYADDLTRHAQAMDDAAEPVIFAATGTAKKEVMAEIASVGNAGEAIAQAVGLPTKGGFRTGGMLDDFAAGMQHMLDAGTGEFEFVSYVRKMRKAAESTAKRIRKIAARKERNAAGKVFNELDEFKRTIGSYRERMGGSYQRAHLPSMAATMDEVAGLYKQFQYHLEDAALYGEKAAAMQKEVNAAWNELLSRSKFEAKYRYRRRTGQKDWGEVSARQGRYEYQQDPRGWRSFVDDLGEDQKIQLDREWLAHQRQSRETLIDTMAKHYDMGEELGKHVSSYRSARKAFEDVLKNAENTVGLQNQLRQLGEATRGTGFGAEVGVIGGALVGGPLGALAGGAIGAILNPERTLRQVATIHRIASQHTQAIKNAVGRYVDAVKKVGKRAGGARRLGAPAAVGSLMGSSFSDRKRTAKNRREAFGETVAELQAFVTGSQAGHDRLTRSTETLARVAPKTAQAVQFKAVQAAKYLLAQAPKNPGAPSMFKDRWQPSELQLAKFERVLKAVADPKSLLNDLANSQLTHVAVQAVREVYPKMYMEMVSEIVDNIDELREQLPYKDRIQLSVLFGVPVDPTMRPEFIASMQQSHLAMPDPEKLAGPPQARAGAAIHPERHLTEAQRLASKA